MLKNHASISHLVGDAVAKLDELKLTEKEINLLELCRLIVDIEYKARYGESLGENNNIMYTESKQINKVLTDQIPPVDTVCQAYQRGIPGK